MELVEALKVLTKYSAFQKMNLMDENIAYLREIAIKLNDVAVDLYENSENMLAMDLYISSFELMVKLLQKEPISTPIYELIKSYEEKVATGIEKINDKLQNITKKNNCEQYYSLSSTLRSCVCLSDAIKICDFVDMNQVFYILTLNLSMLKIKEGMKELVKEQLQIALALLSESSNDVLLKVSILNSLGCLEFKDQDFNNSLSYFLDAKILGNNIIMKCNYETSSRLNKLLGIVSNNIGRIYLLEGKYDEALAQCSDSIRRSKSLFVDEEILVCVYNIGIIHSVKGELSKAVECYQYFLRHTNNLSQDENNLFSNEDSVTLLLDICLVFAQQNMFGEKSSDIFHCLAIIQQLRDQNGNDHHTLPSMFQFIAEVFSDLSCFQFTIIFLLEQLRLGKKYLGDSHPSVASTLNSIGEIYLQNNEYPKALDYFEMTLKVLSVEKTEMSVRQYAVTVFNIGKLFFHTSSFKLALKNFTIASCVLRDHFGAHDMNLGDMLHQIGMLQAHLGHLDESLELLSEALMIRKLNYGNNHILVAKTLFHIGRNHELRGEHRESLDLYNETLSIIKNQASNTDLTNEALVITVLNKISQASQAIGELKDAIAAYEEILRLLHVTVGRNHTLVASLLNLLGNLYIEYGLSERGLILFEKSEEIMNHPDNRDNDNDSRSDYEEAVFEALGYNFGPNHAHAAAA